MCVLAWPCVLCRQYVANFSLCIHPAAQLDIAARTMHLVYSNQQEEDVSGPDLEDMLQSGQLSEGWHPRNRE